MEEAAHLDGASRARFLRQILFPLVLTGLVATSVFSFISLTMALLVFYKPDDPDWGGVMAGSTVMTIPVLIFFVLVQRRLVSGLGGAVKD